MRDIALKQGFDDLNIRHGYRVQAASEQLANSIKRKGRCIPLCFLKLTASELQRALRTADAPDEDNDIGLGIDLNVDTAQFNSVGVEGGKRKRQASSQTPSRGGSRRGSRRGSRTPSVASRQVWNILRTHS